MDIGTIESSKGFGKTACCRNYK